MFYSRVGVPVVYTLKNLLYGLVFSDFVWDYFSGHYKMRAKTYQEEIKGKKGTGKGVAPA